MNERKKAFIRALAEYLAGPQQVRKSLELLQASKTNAKEWAALRNATPLFGYPTVDEAEIELTKFLE